MSKFLKFIYVIIILSFLFYVERGVSSASPFYCVDDDYFCFGLCLPPMIDHCTLRGQCICITISTEVES
ncbi:late nodulin [Medicago truncatula]|uniref:Late nodulin n=2 Tax=Medicago truncatula TaxID=3880 RepID=G7JQQ4_MEDTR|nr:late nodulin [Medicago truncatula]